MIIDLNEKLTKDFRLGEALWLQDWSIYVIPNEQTYRGILLLSSRLQEVKEFFGRNLLIHSWHRPRAYSKFIGASDPDSAHIMGVAVDIEVEGLDCAEAELALEKHLEEFDINLLQNSIDSLHIDVLNNRPKRYFTY